MHYIEHTILNHMLQQYTFLQVVRPLTESKPRLLVHRNGVADPIVISECDNLIPFLCQNVTTDPN